MSYDHYDPQFYLHGFKVEGSKQSIFVYTRNADPKKRNIEKVGGAHGYESDEAKEFFKDKDNKWAQFFQGFRDTKDKFAFLRIEENRYVLAEFIGFEICRTPKFSRGLQSFQDTAEDIRDFLKESKRGHVERLRKHGLTKKEAVKEADNNFRFPRQLLSSTEEQSPKEEFQEIRAYAEELIPYLLGRVWTILDGSDSKKSFVTADNPVSLRHPDGAVFLDLKDQLLKSQICFPLCSDYAILLTPMGGLTALAKDKAPDEGIDDFNRVTVSFAAYEEVYADRADSQIQALFDTAEPYGGVKWKWISDEEWRN